jgi:hypothetical protein
MHDPVLLSRAGVLGWEMFIGHGGLEKDESVVDKCVRRPRTFPNANRDWKAAMKRADFTATPCYDLVHSYCTKLLQRLIDGEDIRAS